MDSPAVANHHSRPVRAQHRTPRARARAAARPPAPVRA